MIARRHVFHIGGYDPISPETQLNRFERSLRSFRKTWGVQSNITTVPEVDEVSAVWDVGTSGQNWETHTTYEMLRWDDLIMKDHERGMASRLFQSLVTLWNWIITGTLRRFMVSSWKYSGFFLFPYLWVTFFAVCGVALGWGISSLAGLGTVATVGVTAVVAFIVFVGLLTWYGPRKPINHVFDDWIFSREFVYGQRPQMERRIDAFAARIVACARTTDAQEIVIVGHCLGAALTMKAVARALGNDPDLVRHGPKICVLTVGATIPKFSLHPKGDHVRQATRLIADTHEIRWAEHHTRDDAISFYRFDPVTLKKVPRDRGDGRPNIRRVQLHDMMDPASFKRHRFNFMRMHYQVVMGNDQQARYDYCMIICGPLPFEDSTSAQGPLGRFGANAELLGASGEGGGAPKNLGPAAAIHAAT